MSNATGARAYLNELITRLGTGWNQFWYRAGDPLPACVLRIIAGCTALYLVATFGFDLERFLASDGILSLETLDALRAGTDREFRFSYLDYLSTPQALWTGYWVGLGILACFAAGFHTRLMSVLSLVVVLSFMHRAPILTSEVDPVLAFIMAYLCLTPCGAFLSIDRWLLVRRGAAAPGAAGGRTAHRSHWATLGTRLIQVHLSVVYLMMGLGKLYNDVWWNGTAVWWLAVRQESSLVDFTWLAGKELLGNAWTHAIVAYELCFAVFIWNRLARPLLLAMGVPIWLGLALLTGMTPFCLLMLGANIVFVSPEAIRALLGRRCPAELLGD